MAVIKALIEHKCNPPSMVEKIVMVRVPRVDTWGRLFSLTKEVQRTIYKAERALWTCPECRGEWGWGTYVPHMWSQSKVGEEKWEWREV